MTLRHAAWVALASLLLPACGSGTVKQTLGLDRAAPDEFRVLSRPPLSVPPQFTLAPPGTTEAPSTMAPTDKQAQDLLLGNKTAKPATTASKTKGKSGPSNAESQFLKNAGADKADPNVRKELVEQKLIESEQKEERPWWNPWEFGKKKEATVDAAKESERIRQNQAEGKPATDGSTPEKREGDHGPLGELLGY